jgi:GntP family gluconate:H+ symporter
MNAATAVTTSVVLAVAGFAGSIGLLMLLIAKWKWHVFLALLLPILLFGVLPGIQRNNFISAFEKGFGNTLGKIGIVIVLGSIIAEALRHTGAIQVITRSMVRLVGARRMPFALTLTGFVIGISIFSDVAYVILNPLVHSAAHAMGVGMGTMSVGLVGALQLTHAIVPPTPGPLAAAALLGADIGKIIVFGSIASLGGAVAGWLWGQFVAGPRMMTRPSDEFSSDGFLESVHGERLPSAWRAYAPIIVPVLLISAQSVAALTLARDQPARVVLDYAGWPVVALTIGLWLAFRNAAVVGIENRGATMNGWVRDGLATSAMILVVTGLGGSLSEILKGTPAVDFVTGAFTANGLPPILLPFMIGVIGNMLTGSTTVGVITAGSLVAPMLGSLHLSPEAAMLSGASGSVIIKYVNSSYFWVCTSLSRLEVREALLGYGGVTLVGGVVSFAVVWVLWAAGLV